jgi:hypothetical protein
MGKRKRKQPSRLDQQPATVTSARRYWEPRVGHVGRRPQVGEDILVYTPTNVRQPGLSPCDWQPACVLKVRELAGGGPVPKKPNGGRKLRCEFDVRYYGWDGSYDDTVADDSIRPMTGYYVSKCQDLVGQAKEVMRTPAYLAGLPRGWVLGAGRDWVEASGPGEGFVRNTLLPKAGMCRVVGMAVRQMEKTAPMILAYEIEYKLESQDKFGGWVDASVIDLSVPPPATLSDHDDGCMRLDITEREGYLDHEGQRRGVESVRVQLERNTLWVALEDFTMFVTSWGPGEQSGGGYSKWDNWPRTLVAKFQTKKMPGPSSGSTTFQDTKVVPAHFLDAVTECLPWTATERCRHSGDGQWLQQALEDELAKIGRQELLVQSAIKITERRSETLWFDVCDFWLPIDLVWQHSRQPLLSSKDLGAFILGRALNGAESKVWKELCDGALRRFLHSQKAILSMLHADSGPAIAGDNIESVVVAALRALEGETRTTACTWRRELFSVPPGYPKQNREGLTESCTSATLFLE